MFGPSTAEAFAAWAGIAPAEAQAAFGSLGASLTIVRTPIGEARLLASDEAAMRDPGPPIEEQASAARQLPSGDAYLLLQGPDLELLVPEPRHRRALWPARVWPGAFLLGGVIVGTWRRAGAMVSIEAWHPLARPEREAIVAEALALPLPGREGRITVRFEG